MKAIFYIAANKFFVAHSAGEATKMAMDAFRKGADETGLAVEVELIDAETLKVVRTLGNFKTEQMVKVIPYTEEVAC